MISLIAIVYYKLHYNAVVAGVFLSLALPGAGLTA